MHPDYFGRGLFSSLTYEGMRRLPELGRVDRIEGPTHVNNYPVQRGLPETRMADYRARGTLFTAGSRIRHDQAYYAIPFNRPPIATKEAEYVNLALRSGHISGDGDFTKRCHGLLESLLGAPKVLLTTSCTHALEMAATSPGS